jgi:DNA-binding XRE family transcriptional regulator
VEIEEAAALSASMSTLMYVTRREQIWGSNYPVGKYVPSVPICTVTLRDVTSSSLTGRELRKQRLRLGLTQIQLAELFGMNRGSIIRYENSDSPIPKHIEWAMKGLQANAASIKRG